MRIELDANSRVLVLTGAGISAESGVATFRDAGGLWEGHDVMEVASLDGFMNDPVQGWRFYSQRRAGLDGIVPNAGHAALVALEARLGDRFLLTTQNVDGLHTAAGSVRMLEMHGNLMRTRCSVCARPPFADTAGYLETLPVCRLCGERGETALLRPDVVWFGEMLSSAVLDRIDRFIVEAGRRLVFLAVGTSGLVFPAAGLVDATRAVGGTSWLVNLEAPANADRFDHVALGPSTQVLPELLG